MHIWWVVLLVNWLSFTSHSRIVNINAYMVIWVSCDGNGVPFLSIHKFSPWSYKIGPLVVGVGIWKLAMFMHCTILSVKILVISNDPSSFNPVKLSGGRQDLGGNQGSEIPAAGKKDGHFHRTSSSSEADVSETKFIDMLKSNAKKTAPQEFQGAVGASDSTDGAQGGRSGKKKGKKVRPLDSAFLGFKVTSNRIMMGEIQRLDD